MMSKRASLSLDTSPKVDINQFKPRSAPIADDPRNNGGDAVANAHGFTARETDRPERRQKPRLRKRKPFDAMLSIRAYSSDVEAFHKIAEQQGWKSGRLLSELIKFYVR